jgi:hypothetical protein
MNSPATTEAAFRALQVLVLDPVTRRYLAAHDPKALQQACKALHDVGLRWLLFGDAHRESASDVCWYCFAVLGASGRCAACADTPAGEVTR